MKPELVEILAEDSLAERNKIRLLGVPRSLAQSLPKDWIPDEDEFWKIYERYQRHLPDDLLCFIIEEWPGENYNLWLETVYSNVYGFLMIRGDPNDATAFT